MKTLSIGRVLTDTCIALGAVAVVSVGVARPTVAQERGDPGWSLRLTPYYWATNLGGQVTLGFPEVEQIVGDFKVPVGDTVLDNGWAARLEVAKHRLRVIATASRATLANAAVFTRVSDRTVSLSGNYDFAWSQGELFGAVQIGPFTQAYAIDVYLGARYVRWEQILTVTTGPEAADVTQSWVDPVIGGRAFIEMGAGFWSMFNVDLGGFGVGSEFTWVMAGELGFRIVKPLDISMRYNFEQVEYDNGQEGVGRFVWESGVSQGWFFGATLKL